MSAESKIVCRPDVRSGLSTIEGTRTTVTDVVRTYWSYVPRMLVGFEPRPPHPERGLVISMEDIAAELQPHFQVLSVEDVKAALAYWYAHEDEIQRQLDQEDLGAIEARRKYPRPA